MIKIFIKITAVFVLSYSRLTNGQSDSLATSYCDVNNITNGCGCFNKTNALHDIGTNNIQCCCTGPSVTSIPNNFSTTVKVLIFRRMSLVSINENDFQDYNKVEKIIIWHMPNLLRVDANAFAPMTNLQKLSFFNCPKLKLIDGTFKLDNTRFLALTITNTGLQEVPKVQTWRESLKVPTVDLSHNKIETVGQRVFEKVELYSLTLSYNKIKTIEDYVIAGAKIGLLKLDNNPLYSISEKAFANVSTLVQLDLSHSELNYLPQAGLKNVQKIFLNETHNLKRLPSIFVFTSLEEAHLTYPYHCCLFKHIKVSSQYSKEGGEYRGNIEEMSKKHCEVPTTSTVPYHTSSVPSDISSSVDYVSLGRGSTSTETTTINPAFMFRKKRYANKNASSKNSENVWPAHGTWGDAVSAEPESQQQTLQELTTADDGWGVWGDLDDDEKSAPMRDGGVAPPRPTVHGHWLPDPQPTFGNRVVATFCNSSGFSGVQNYYSKLKCYPQPDALNPCEDVVGFPWLRAFIWVVWIMAIVGNASVIVALCATQQSRVRVNHFLIMNLAFADFLIGIYLAMLAVQDVHTAGVYYNFAVDWQTGAGCKTAGFLSVFASELSIFTMVLISFEVWYNTKYIFYGKRFQLAAAVIAMFFGYVFAFFTALIPLTGIANGYSATSTCLPLEVNSSKDKLYLIIILVINLSGFAYIVFNYISVYCMVAGKSTPTAHTQDMAIAKRMAVLIVTDFVCWAPTVFFGLTAAAGYPLISISTAKILLVLFYPINAFCNPFLYVFLTKMFRKDMSRLARKHTWLKKMAMARRKKSSLFNSNYLLTFTTWASKKHSTPRNSNNSVLIPPLISVGTADKFDPTVSTYYYNNPRKSDADSGDPLFNNGSGFLSSVMRRKSTKSTRKFSPHMSDIIENSNSNSAEDDQCSHQSMIDGTRCHHRQGRGQLPSVRVDEIAAKAEVHTPNYWYTAIPSPKSLRPTTQETTSFEDDRFRRASDSSSTGTWSLTRTDGSAGSTITSKMSMSSDSQRSDCRDLVTYSVNGSITVPRKTYNAPTGSVRSLESGYFTSALPTPEVYSPKAQTIFRYSSSTHNCSDTLESSMTESIL